ncbi:hypothetical protein VTJ83DRAFT_7101 [Remersonia thermophila]|uniref:Uncharacterized protein n=1 Tax=Remersonia thermophila TaxID=72144 RepID=A0ABR4D421_9PEZI
MCLNCVRGWTDQAIHKTNNQNPENDPTTFGQLVPLLLITFTVFTFLQIISGMTFGPLFSTTPLPDILSERIRNRRERERIRKYNSLRHNKDSDSPSPDSDTPYSWNPGLNGQDISVGQLYDPAVGEKYKSQPTVTVNATQPSSSPFARNGTPSQNQSASTPALPPILQQTHGLGITSPAFETIALDTDAITTAPTLSGNRVSDSGGTPTPRTGVAVNAPAVFQTVSPTTGSSPDTNQTSAPAVSLSHTTHANTTSTNNASFAPPASRAQAQPSHIMAQGPRQLARSETEPVPRPQQPQTNMYTAYMDDAQQTPWDSQPGPGRDPGETKSKKNKGFGGLFSRSKNASTSASTSELESSPWAGGVYYGSGAVPNSAPLYGSYPVIASPPTFYSPDFASTGGMGATYWPVGQQHHYMAQSLSAASLPAVAGGPVVGLGLESSAGGNPAPGEWLGRSNTEPMVQGQPRQWPERSQTDPVVLRQGQQEQAGHGWVQLQEQQPQQQGNQGQQQW